MRAFKAGMIFITAILCFNLSHAVETAYQCKYQRTQGNLYLKIDTLKNKAYFISETKSYTGELEIESESYLLKFNNVIFRKSLWIKISKKN